MPQPLKVLLVEDNPEDAELILAQLRVSGFEPHARIVASKTEYLNALDPDLDVILSDYHLPQFDGGQALELLKAHGLDVPFILISGALGDLLATQFMRDGAADYFLKDRLARLGSAVTRVVAQKQLHIREQQAAKQTRQLAAIVAASDDAIISLTPEGRITSWNEGAKRMFGHTAVDAVGGEVSMIVPPSQQAYAESILGMLRSGRRVPHFETLRLRKDGTELPVSVSVSLIKDTTGKITSIAMVLRDISQRKRNEQQIERLSRVRAVSSAVNAAIVRLRNRRALQDEICSIAVTLGNFGLAWIGAFDAASLTVTPVAWAGAETEDLKHYRSVLRVGTPQGQGNIGRAVRDRKPVFSNNIEAGTGGPHLQKMHDLGYRSVAVLPFLLEQAVTGVVVLFARERDYFTSHEFTLLVELAGNVSFALEQITKQQKLEKLTRVRAVSGEINALIVRAHDRRTLLGEACRIAVEYGGFGIAWIGMLDTQTQDIIPVACAGGGGEAMMEPARNTAPAGTPPRQTLANRAVSARHAVFSNDLTNEPGPGGARRREALKRGYRSVISLPLLVANTAVGAMSLFAAEPDFFDDEEIGVLTEIAGNISFALDTIQKDEALAASEKKLDGILGSLQEVVWSLDPSNGRILYINDAVQEISGRPAGDFVARSNTWRRLIHYHDRAYVFAGVRRLLQEGKQSQEFRIVRAGGEVRTVLSRAQVRYDDAGNAVRIDGTLSDISERVRA